MRITKDNVYQLLQFSINIKSLWSKTNLRSVHVAFVIKRGRVLELATNELGSRKQGCGYAGRTIHAERAVIKKIGDHTKLNGAIMIVIRLSRGTHQMINSIPCHGCRPHLEKCVKEYGLRCIYYSP
jgi:hypothetical protein